jgi:hypothetical protein
MNARFEAICDQCGAPISLTSDANSTPAPEAVINRTRYRLPRKLTLIGVWAISLPNVLGGGYFAFWVFKHLGGLAGYIMFWGDIGLTLLWFIILYRVTKNYFFRDQRQD